MHAHLMDSINRGHLRELNTFLAKADVLSGGKQCSMSLAPASSFYHFISRQGIFSQNSNSKRGRLSRTIVIFKNDR